MKHLVYLLAGDPFLVEEKSRMISSAIEKESEGLSKQTFHIKETPLSDVLAQARTLPFLVSCQIFRIKDASEIKKADIEPLVEYLKIPAPKTYMIFEAASLEKKSPLLEALKNRADVTLFEDAAKQGASVRFIREKLRQFGKRMSPEAQKRLEQQAGESPAFLDSILNQLINYAGEKEDITDEMVDKFEEDFSTVDVFQLIDAISSRNSAEALRLLSEYADESPKEILSFMGLLHWQLKRLWKASVLLEEGADERSVLQKCKVFHRQGPFMKQVRGLGRRRVEKAIEDLFQLDWAVKTGRAEDRLGLERWVAEVTA